jgi:hypothetical protein
VYWNFALVMSAATFLFEIGLLGTALVLFLHWMLLRDALFIAKRDDSLMGTVALGYVGVWVTVTIGLFYSLIHSCEAISFLFWFVSGLIAARRQRLAVSRAKVHSAISDRSATMKSEAVGAA